MPSDTPLTATRSTAKEDRVDSTSISYDLMAPLWDLVDTLRGNTPAMRNARHKFLPQEQRESEPAYNARLHRSFLYGAYGDTIEKLAGKPFSRNVTIEGDAPGSLALIEDQADMTGRNLSEFSKDVFEAAVDHGLTHILVDFPVVDRGMNLGQERQEKIHPYFTHIKATQLIAWREEKAHNGESKLTQIRIYEKRTEADGEFGERVVEYIRVINAPVEANAEQSTDAQVGTWQLWRRDRNEQAKAQTPSDEFTIFKRGTHDFPGIPLVTVYSDRTNFMMARPAMEDLAWLNIAHWQSSSDQRNILRFARVGILFQKGVSEEELEKGITIGPSNMIRSTNPDSDMKYVEHSGKAIGAGRQDLVDLKEEMQVLGLQPFLVGAGNRTATEVGAGEERNLTEIQSWIRGLENALNQAYEMASIWAGVELPEDFKVNIFNEFGITSTATADTEVLLKMRMAGTISHETFLEEVKRRGVLSDAVDVDEEIALVELDAPQPEDDDDEEEGNEEQEESTEEEDDARASDSDDDEESADGE